MVEFLDILSIGIGSLVIVITVFNVFAANAAGPAMKSIDESYPLTAIAGCLLLALPSVAAVFRICLVQFGKHFGVSSIIGGGPPVWPPQPRAFNQLLSGGTSRKKLA